MARGGCPIQNVTPALRRPGSGVRARSCASVHGAIDERWPPTARTRRHERDAAASDQRAARGSRNERGRAGQHREPGERPAAASGVSAEPVRGHACHAVERRAKGQRAEHQRRDEHSRSARRRASTRATGTGPATHAAVSGRGASARAPRRHASQTPSAPTTACTTFTRRRHRRGQLRPARRPSPRTHQREERGVAAVRARTRRPRGPRTRRAGRGVKPAPAGEVDGVAPGTRCSSWVRGLSCQ